MLLKKHLLFSKCGLPTIDKKVAGKSDLTRDQKNNYSTNLKYVYEDKIGKGEMTIEQAMGGKRRIRKKTEL